MAVINPYLNFPGNTEEALNFYKSVFGGEFKDIMRFKDTPDGEKLSDVDKNKIMHIALPVGNNIIMATDALESMGFKLTAGTNSHIAIEAESREEAEKIFYGLSEGGKITMPLADMFWGAYYGNFTDKFGVQWMVNYTYNND